MASLIFTTIFCCENIVSVMYCRLTGGIDQCLASITQDKSHESHLTDQPVGLHESSRPTIVSSCVGPREQQNHPLDNVIDLFY